MTDAYIFLNQIIGSTGLTQLGIAVETGLSLNTVKRALNRKSINASSYKLIKAFHKEVVTSPYPAEINRLHDLMNVMKRRLTRTEYAEYLEVDLEKRIETHPSYGAGDLTDIRLEWLFGHIHFDRADYLHHNTIIEFDTARQHYQRAMGLLISNHESLVIEIYKLQQSIVSLEILKRGGKVIPNDPALYGWLREICYVDHALVVLEAEPWNVVVARNGLRVASTLNMLEACLKLWKLTGKDTDVLSEPDLRWFRQQMTKQANNSTEINCLGDVQ
ncbi:MAG: hypothetical protein ABFS45_04440 [Pseudomonadota bacterium]